MVILDSCRPNAVKTQHAWSWVLFFNSISLIPTNRQSRTHENSIYWKASTKSIQDQPRTLAFGTLPLSDKEVIYLTAPVPLRSLALLTVSSSMMTLEKSHQHTLAIFWATQGNAVRPQSKITAQSHCLRLSSMHYVNAEHLGSTAKWKT